MGKKCKVLPSLSRYYTQATNILCIVVVKAQEQTIRHFVEVLNMPTIMKFTGGIKEIHTVSVNAVNV